MKLSAVKRLFVILAFLVLAWAQCVGVGLRFVCLCSGSPIETLMDHCHGPHGDECLTSHSPHFHEHHGSERDDDSDTERHTAIKNEFEVATMAKAPVAPLYIATLEWVMERYVLVLPETWQLQGHAFGRPPPEFPPPGIRLTHTVALLI